MYLCIILKIKPVMIAVLDIRTLKEKNNFNQSYLFYITVG